MPMTKPRTLPQLLADIGADQSDSRVVRLLEISKKRHARMASEEEKQEYSRVLGTLIEEARKARSLQCDYA